MDDVKDRDADVSPEFFVPFFLSVISHPSSTILLNRIGVRKRTGRRPLVLGPAERGPGTGQRPIATVPPGAGRPGRAGRYRCALAWLGWWAVGMNISIQSGERGPIPGPPAPSVGGPSLDATVIRGAMLRPSLAGSVVLADVRCIGRPDAPSAMILRAGRVAPGGVVNRDGRRQEVQPQMTPTDADEERVS
jgi:hypothetical protein